MFRLRAVGGRLLLALALGLGSLGAGPVAGPTPPETELDPPRCFPHAQLRKLAQHFHDDPNFSPPNEIYERLISPFCESDLWWLGYYYLILSGYNHNTVIEIIQGAKIEREQHFRQLEKLKQGEVTPFQGSCTQLVEEGSPTGGVSFCTFVEEDWNCDGDPSDRDYDFLFPMPWYGNPDYLRWKSNNIYVALMFRLLYGGNLLGHDLCNYSKWLCIGDRGVTAAGGPTQVRNSLEMRHP
jgi:hypothetical protein